MGKIRNVCIILLSFILAFDNQSSKIGILIHGVILSMYLIFFLFLTKRITGRLILDKEQYVRLFDKAYLLLLPFTIFALVGRFFLGWDTVQAFISTGLMGCGAFLSAEGSRMTNRKKTLVVTVTLMCSLTFLGLMQIAGLLKGVQIG